MNILLTKEQIKEIRFLQKRLDLRVRELNNIDLDKDLTFEKYLALKTELFEFANEIESFKYWKKNKGKKHILEEACDTLHFLFSIAIDKDVEIELENISNQEEYDINDLIGIMDAMISDCFIGRDWEGINGIIALLCVTLGRCGYDADDLYNSYIDKNKENHNRQSNNY